MRARRSQPDSMAVLLRSRAFLLVLCAIVLLGGVFLLRAWHENRNDLLEAQIDQLKRRIRVLRQELIEWRVREVQARSLPAIQAKIEEFHLDLRRPSEQREDQILTVIEPDWSAMIQPQVPADTLSARAHPRAASPSASRARAAGLWAGGGATLPQPSAEP